MTNERFYSLKPGEVILHSKEPIAVEYRRELRSYLNEYPSGKDRKDLKGRLRSYTESGFYSACFELYLHNLLARTCENINRHPSLPSVSTHPDFEANHRVGKFFLEATLALESDEYQAQESRLREMIDALRGIKGNLVLWAQPVTHLPDNFPLDRISDFLEYEIDKLDPTTLEMPKTIRFQDKFYDNPVIIDFEVMDSTQDSCDSVIQAWGSPEAQEVTTHRRIRRSISIKANRYGEMNFPYVIAVWPRTKFPLTSTSALRALYGDQRIAVSRDPTQALRELPRELNGAFNTIYKGKILNRQVSAVALYREHFFEKSYIRQLIIYHNPYCNKRITPDIFLHFPQFVFQNEKDNGGHMEWFRGENPWDD